MSDIEKKHPKSLMSAFKWVPTLYFAEGIPYVMVVTVSTILYKRMGISNADIAFFTGLLYLPWLIKPFWSPFVDILKTKRWWIFSMQIFIALALGLVGFFLPFSHFFKITLLVFWVMAFASATHDIAADGFYMLGLEDEEQSFFVGIRSTFYRLAFILGQGLLVILAGYLEKIFAEDSAFPTHSDIAQAWSITFYGLSIFFIVIAIWHRFALPKPQMDAPKKVLPKEIFSEFANSFVSFFKKKNIVLALSFMLIFRLSESMLVKLSSPFMLDARSIGGLGLNTGQVGLIYGTVGMIALTIGGIIGGFAVNRHGLRRWMFPMALSITLPNVVYLMMSYTQPTDILVVNSMVALEQFGYGFGFTAYMMYLIYFSQGEQATSHYAISTAFMAAGMMLPGMIAGKLQELVGYSNFFIIVMILVIPTLLIVPFMKIDEDFGRNK